MFVYNVAFSYIGLISSKCKKQARFRFGLSQTEANLTCFLVGPANAELLTNLVTCMRVAVRGGEGKSRKGAGKSEGKSKEIEVNRSPREVNQLLAPFQVIQIIILRATGVFTEYLSYNIRRMIITFFG